MTALSHKCGAHRSTPPIVKRVVPNSRDRYSVRTPPVDIIFAKLRKSLFSACKNDFWQFHGNLGISGKRQNLGDSYWIRGCFLSLCRVLIFAELLVSRGLFRSLRNDNKVLNNKISIFKIVFSWRFPRKRALWVDLALSAPSLCPMRPPSKAHNLFSSSSRRLRL